MAENSTQDNLQGNEMILNEQNRHHLSFLAVENALLTPGEQEIGGGRDEDY